MASTQLFDPHTLLRLSPLISSSFSLWYCVDQHMFYNNFIIPANRAKGSALLPLYWKSILTPGLSCIFSLYGLTIGTAAANLYLGPPDSSRWYAIGAGFAMAHFAFVPLVAKSIKAIVEDESKGQSWRDQQRWLRVHAVRSVFVDFPGWLCFLTAVLQSVKVV
jgi:hypothetical protein